MKFLHSPIILLLLTSFTAHSRTRSHWINELHYIDNDLAKGFEIAGPAYVDLSTWSYIVYNEDGSIRSDGSLHTYSTIEREPPGSLGCIWVDVDLNPSGGGIALLEGTTLLDFISYEVSLTVDINSMSEDAYQIPVNEDPASQRMSLQLTGVGVNVDSFRWWQSIFPSFGSTNVNQAFMSECVNAPLNDVWHELLPSADPNYNCTLYESRMGYCAFTFATLPGVQGLTGQQACCICGGGVTWGPTTSPSLSPSFAPSKGPSLSPSIAPTKSIGAYEQELADCQNQTRIYQEILDDYTSTIEMCEARGISLSCTSSPTLSPSTVFPTQLPSGSPETDGPSAIPSETPSNSSPSVQPSLSPQTLAPTDSPSDGPSLTPSATDPSQTPSNCPSMSAPTVTPSSKPQTTLPSRTPSNAPSLSAPTTAPIIPPSSAPSEAASYDCDPFFTVPFVFSFCNDHDYPGDHDIGAASTHEECEVLCESHAATAGSGCCEYTELGRCLYFVEPFSGTPMIIPGGRGPGHRNDATACFSIDPTMEPTVDPTFSPTQEPSEPPSAIPSGNPSCDCRDLRPPAAPGGIWSEDNDIDGGVGRFTCEFISFVPDLCVGLPNYGLTATEVCCTCGGGSCSAPSSSPIFVPTATPTLSFPSTHPTFSSPSKSPSRSPTSNQPSTQPTSIPTFDQPSLSPITSIPSLPPTLDSPSSSPSLLPSSDEPSASPETTQPSTSPSDSPEHSDPSVSPTSDEPSVTPTTVPSEEPSLTPSSSLPSQSPETSDPTRSPSKLPTETKVDCYDYTPQTENGTAWYGGQWVDQWYDSRRLMYDCDWYARTNRSLESCLYFSPIYIGLDGLNAQQACCVCGGGITDEPTAAPTSGPVTPYPSVVPSISYPTASPSQSPFTSEPSRTPSFSPSFSPSLAPTASDPSSTPSKSPTISPTFSTPTGTPSSSPQTTLPSSAPIYGPSTGPIVSPTGTPSKTPSHSPTRVPSNLPSTTPSSGPTCQCFDLRPPDAPNGEWHERDGEGRFTCAFYEIFPDNCLTIGRDGSYAMYGHTASTACCVCGGGYCGVPTESPTVSPSISPTALPTFDSPSVSPSIQPTSSQPSSCPSVAPTSDSPSLTPTVPPVTASPTNLPSSSPSRTPTMNMPTVSPSGSPVTSLPTKAPSIAPSQSDPTTTPSSNPTTNMPSTSPSMSPETSYPTVSPSGFPSASPSERVHCVDFVPEGEVEWYDGYPTALKWTCEIYEQFSLAEGGRRNYCDIFTNYDRDANFGMIANDACCFCGGGITSEPTAAPTSSTSAPSETPARVPTKNPSRTPTSPPDTDEPSAAPVTESPSRDPSVEPTVDPTFNPTDDPTMKPSENPSSSPTHEPSTNPSANPTMDPTFNPSLDPTDTPTIDPTFNPSLAPTDDPTEGTNMPSTSPTTSQPTPCECVDLIPPGQPKWHDITAERFDCDWYATDPTNYCDGGRVLSNFGLNAMQACCVCEDPLSGARGGSCFTPSEVPTVNPTRSPVYSPSGSPTISSPSRFPSAGPTEQPTYNPTLEPTLMPTQTPSIDPTLFPTTNPSNSPTISEPTVSPSNSPITTQPSLAPSMIPTVSDPTRSPSQTPSSAPTERTCAEKVEDTLEEIEICQTALDEAQSNLTECESTTVSQETYDELLQNITDCEAIVSELEEDLYILENGELAACEGNVYVQVYRSDFEFFTGVYFMNDDGDATSYTAINNDEEQVLKHLDNGTWVLTNGDTQLVTPVVLTGIFPPSLDQWVDPNGLLVIVKMSCYEPQVVDDCSCVVYDNDEALIEFSGMDCATSALQFGGTGCDHPLYGSYISHFCPATCGRSWAETLIDDDDAVGIYGSTPGIDWPFSTCRSSSAYCVDEYVQHPVYRLLCPIATAECENLLDVCDLVCTTARRRRLQDDTVATCPYATVTAYHSNYVNLDGTYTLTDASNLVYESDSSTLSYSGGIWTLGGVLTTETNEGRPPAAANWRSSSGSIVVATVECALTIDSMTYEECTAQLEETQQELDDCTEANTRLEADIASCYANCAANQEAGAECEAAKAMAEARDAFVAVETVDSGTDIGWEESQYVDRGLDPDVAARLRYHNNEIVYDNLDGTYTRTCIAYSTSATDSCDHDDLICPGGSTYGWPGNQYSRLAEAMARPDRVHPDCPTGCQLTDWWADQLQTQGLSSNEICVIGDAFYYIEERQYVFTCIAYSDDYDSLCPNNNIVCAGTNSEGYKIYGWPSYQTQLLETALEQVNHRYPYCPNY